MKLKHKIEDKIQMREFLNKHKEFEKFYYEAKKLSSSSNFLQYGMAEGTTKIFMHFYKNHKTSDFILATNSSHYVVLRLRDY